MFFFPFSKVSLLKPDKFMRNNPLLEGQNLKFFLKMEAIINRVLLLLWSSLVALCKKVTPKIILNFSEKMTNKIKQREINFKGKFKSIGAKSKSGFLSGFEKTMALKKNVSEKVSTQVTKAKEIDYKRVNYFKVIGSVLLLLILPLKKLKVWVWSLDPKMLVGLTTASMVTGLVSINIYTTSKKIAEKTGMAREPASEVNNGTAPSKRPGYYKRNERELRIRNMTMPIYVGDAKELRSLTIDFTIISSNKYIKEYFFQNTYLIRDRMFSSLEPIVPEFPLTIEGKAIIKDKLIRELQVLLDEMKIKGSVKEIHIHSILAG